MGKKEPIKPTAFNKEEAWHVLDNILTMIERCDTKISYLLSAMSLATIFELNLVNFDFFKTNVMNNATKGSISLSLLFIAAAICTVISIVLAMYSLSPKLKPLNESKEMKSKSALYFATIISDPYTKYNSGCRSMNDDMLYNDLLSQIYINAAIADKKYKFLKVNTRFFMASFVSLLAFVVLQNILY